MGDKTNISWADKTFQPWIGCTKISAGCQHCYAEALMDKRFGTVQWGPQGTRKRTSDANWRKPLAWDKKAKAEGRRYRVFCSSLADVFEDKPDQPEMNEWRTDLFNLILATPNLDWLLLTKRPENVIGMTVWCAPGCKMPDNVWIGTSVENQEQADKRIPELLRIPATVRFLSVEPLIGPVSLTGFDGKVYRPWLDHHAWDVGIHWVIVGGESGPNARPMHPQWVRTIMDQCVAAGIPFHFKQWGEWIVSSHVTQEMDSHHAWSWPWATGETGDLQGDTTMMVNVGKHVAGRTLDGREWNEYPR